MARKGKSKGMTRAFPAALAAAGLAFAVPGTLLAVESTRAVIQAPTAIGALPFTPARVDPALARQVARILGEDGLRFTPATKVLNGKERTVTVAVRVDGASARAISVRNTIASASTEQGRQRALEIAPTSYNLGVARGYQSFAQPAKAVDVSAGLRDIAMPDLAEFRPEEARDSKPSRFQSRIAIEPATGRAPRTFDSSGQQIVDLRGSYRLGRNLDVTAGVRVSQDRNRLAPLTDGVEDDQAVYVGTQVRF